MSDTLTLASEHDVADVTTFLQRADRLGCSLTRLLTSGPRLAAMVCVLEKQGMLDTHPTVLGMRVVELEVDLDVALTSANAVNAVDALVETRAVLDRLARPSMRASAVLELPVGQARVPWAGISPPQSGWESLGEMPSRALVECARAGIDEVAAANGLGTNIVTEVRRTVWSRQLEGAPDGIVAGMAFAAFGLGFVVEGDESAVRITSNGAWMRASTNRGEVLARA